MKTASCLDGEPVGVTMLHECRGPLRSHVSLSVTGKIVTGHSPKDCPILLQFDGFHRRLPGDTFRSISFKSIRIQQYPFFGRGMARVLQS